MASVCRIADKVVLIDKQTISWSGTPKEMFVSTNTKIQEFIKPINSTLFFNEKSTKQFICQFCGTVYVRWIGKCEQCNKWNTLVEDSNSKPSGVLSKSRGKKINLEKLNAVNYQYSRIKTNLNELDRVIGGGFVPGSVTLIGGILV